MIKIRNARRARWFADTLWAKAAASQRTPEPGEDAAPLLDAFLEQRRPLRFLLPSTGSGKSFAVGVWLFANLRGRGGLPSELVRRLQDALRRDSSEGTDEDI